MAINVETTKTASENTSSLMRRFTKRVQGSGILQRARSLRFFERSHSAFVKKRRALKTIERRAEFQKMLKMGLSKEAASKRQ